MLFIERDKTLLARELAKSRLNLELPRVSGDKVSCEQEKELLALGRKKSRRMKKIA